MQVPKCKKKSFNSLANIILILLEHKKRDLTLKKIKGNHDINFRGNHVYGIALHTS